jgi:hypothetical protein
LGKLLEQLAHLLRRHTDAGIGYCHRDPVTAVLLSLMSGDGDSAFLGELVGVAQQVQKRLPQAHLIGVQRPDGSVAIDPYLIGVLSRQRFDVIDPFEPNERYLSRIQSPVFAVCSSRRRKACMLEAENAALRQQSRWLHHRRGRGSLFREPGSVALRRIRSLLYWEFCAQGFTAARQGTPRKCSQSLRCSSCWSAFERA